MDIILHYFFTLNKEINFEFLNMKSTYFLIGPTALVLIAIELVSKIEIVAVRITTFGKDRTLLNLFAEENIIFFQKPP